MSHLCIYFSNLCVKFIVSNTGDTKMHSNTQGVIYWLLLQLDLLIQCEFFPILAYSYILYFSSCLIIMIVCMYLCVVSATMFCLSMYL